MLREVAIAISAAAITVEAFAVRRVAGSFVQGIGCSSAIIGHQSWFLDCELGVAAFIIVATATIIVHVRLGLIPGER